MEPQDKTLSDGSGHKVPTVQIPTSALLQSNMNSSFKDDASDSKGSFKDGIDAVKSSSIQKFTMWDNLLARGSVVKLIEETEASNPYGWGLLPSLSLTAMFHWWTQAGGTIYKHPRILIFPFLVVCALCALSVSTVIYMKDLEASRRMSNAQNRLKDIAQMITSDLEKATAPASSLASVWLNSVEMLNWNPRIFPAPDGAPMTVDRSKTHRNMTTMPQSVKNAAQSAMKAALSLSIIPGAAANIQWQPCGVVSYIYPEKGNEVAIGHDLFMDPLRITPSTLTLNSREDRNLQGPAYIERMKTGAVFGRFNVWGNVPVAPCVSTPNMDKVKTIYKNGQHWLGYTTIMFDMTKLMNASFIISFAANESLHVEVVSNKGDVLLTSHPIKYNDELDEGASRGGEAARLPHNDTDPNTMYRMDINFGDLGWSVTVHPKNNHYGPEWFDGVLAGVVISSFVAGWLVLLVSVSSKQRNDLLMKMMPKSAASRIQMGKEVIEAYSNVTIFFSDIVGYTNLAGTLSPIQVMALLNELYTEFDKVCDYWDLYKVETIGDAYMVVGGAPHKYPPEDPVESARRVTRFALDVLDLVQHFESATAGRIQIRCGLNSGPVVAGVVGKAMPRYCLFGDTVNTASRMESNSAAGRVHISTSTKELLEKSSDKFQIEERKDSEKGHTGIMIKGKGIMHTYWVNGCEVNKESSRGRFNSFRNLMKNSKKAKVAKKEGWFGVPPSAQIEPVLDP